VKWSKVQLLQRNFQNVIDNYYFFETISLIIKIIKAITVTHRRDYMSITKREIFQLALIITFFLIFVFVFWLFFGKEGIVNSKGELEQKAFEKYFPVCQGKGVPIAAGFDQFSDETPKVLVIDSNGQPYQTNNGIGGEWNPETIQDVQLVVCIQNIGMISEGCPGYSGMEKVQYYSVYAAKTGKLLDHAWMVLESRCIDVTPDSTSIHVIPDELTAMKMRMRSDYTVIQQ
jgi:hypothetical protein